MLADWDRYFPQCDPIAHHLRSAFPERWVRFHSLPASKRYPEDEAEYAEVLARHNAILGELARAGSDVALVTTGYSGSPEPSRSYPAVVAFDSVAVPWRTIAMHRVEECFDKPSYWHLFVSEWDWRPGAFDPLVRLVADEAVANVLLVASDCRWVLHPYDGGMDVIAESSEARQLLRKNTLPGFRHEPMVCNEAGRFKSCTYLPAKEFTGGLHARSTSPRLRVAARSLCGLQRARH